MWRQTFQPQETEAKKNLPTTKNSSEMQASYGELFFFFLRKCVWGLFFASLPLLLPLLLATRAGFHPTWFPSPKKFMLENGDDGAEETHYVAGSSPDAFSFFRVFLSKSDASAVSKSHSGSVAAGACEQNREETGEKPRGASKEKTNKMCTKKITRQRGTLKTVTMNVKSARQTRKNSSVTTLPRNFTSVAPLRSVSLEPPGGGGGGR